MKAKFRNGKRDERVGQQIILPGQDELLDSPEEAAEEATGQKEENVKTDKTNFETWIETFFQK